VKTKFILLGIVYFFILVSYGMSEAQVNFPVKPIQLVAAFGAGGSGDMVTRALAHEASKFLGQEVAVMAKPGGNGVVGVAYVTAAKPDGYTLGTTHSSCLIIQPWLQDLPSNQLEEITPILEFSKSNILLAVKSDSPFKTLKDYLEYAKKNPGKVTYGHPGFGARPHLVMTIIAAREGIKLNFVSFPGDAQTSAALLGGHVMASGGSPPGYISHVQAGTVRLLAMLEEERVDIFPDVPTVVELGYPFHLPFITILFGPKGIPEPIVKKLEDAFDKATRSPGFREYAIKNAVLSRKHMLREELVKFLATEKARARETLQSLGLEKK
jgi:tripartite-type tricarboxylate transporter receptor subunit TctC